VCTSAVQEAHVTVTVTESLIPTQTAPGFAVHRFHTAARAVQGVRARFRCSSQNAR